MDLSSLVTRRNCIVAIIVTGFSLFALCIRLIPMFAMGHSDLLAMVAMDDPIYNLRQVELILANFPGYGWFEAMTNFPTGTNIYWGPLFPTLIATACLITGAATRPEIIGTALLATPLIAAFTVILMYFVGRIFGDWKTGILASGFTAVISGQFLTYSIYGYIDHHIAEVLFSTTFCLLYAVSLVNMKSGQIHLDNLAGSKTPVFLSVLAGIAYLLGLLVMPTMILFALIAGVFTLIQCMVDFFRGRSSEYLLVLNSAVFLVATAGLLLFGLKSQGLNLSTYSAGLVIAFIGLIVGTAFLVGLSRLLRSREKYWYPAIILVIAAAVCAILAAAAPQIFSLVQSSLFEFFGQQAITETVLEARGWSLAQAWTSFNFGLFLFAGGCAVMVYNNWRDEHPHEVFALVWSLVMAFSAWQHIRYEYYLAIPVAFMSAVCIVFLTGSVGSCRNFLSIFHMAGPGTHEHADRQSSSSPKKRSREKTRGTPETKGSRKILLSIAVVLAILAAVLFTCTSALTDYAVASSHAERLNPDWRESLDWLGNNSPQTGIEYLRIYDRNSFHYPAEAYGVMSWWDYGHMITYIAKRIPNANPFQQGVAGENGSAAFFVTSSEEDASRILNSLGTRYVITDFEMDTGKFPAMATWYNASQAANPYMKEVLIRNPDKPDRAESVYLNTQQYYLTMVSRLHNFDGSMTEGTDSLYLEYLDPRVTSLSLPLVTRGERMDSGAALQRAEDFNRNASGGSHAIVMSASFVHPVGDIPALHHYRLIHESPTNVFINKTEDLKYVKVFEYVKGAHIPGTGVIELDLVSNTGRNFTYRQKSTNGEFIVPFSTTGNPYGVRATGKYRIAGSGQSFDVTESEVLRGLTIT